jgi:branched-chain amino acid transport system substrate-binding protein
MLAGTVVVTTASLGWLNVGRAAEEPVRIGVLTDLSGYLSSALGPGTVDAARMGAEDFGGKVLGRPIEIISADHQNKPDIGAAIARRWIDQENVQVFTGMGNSAVALAVQSLVKERNRIALYVSAATTLLTGKECAPNGIHWGHDTYMLGNAVPKGLLNAGVDTWYLLAADYAFGRSLADDMRKVIEARGGKVVGTAFHPQGTADFSSFVLSAQASGAKAIAILNAGNDTVNAIKQSREFAITDGGKRLVVGLLLVSDAYALGTQVAQGIEFSTTFYWNMNPATAAWARRFYERNKSMPTEAHAGAYSAVLHYLRAAQAAGTIDTKAVLAKMHELPVNDFYSDNLRIREDNRLMRPAYIARIKKPADQREPWDLYDIVTTIAPNDAFRPLAESDCPTVKKN